MDRMERSGVEFHTRVGQAFERFLTPGWQAEHPECGPIVGLDATGSINDVGARVRHLVGEHSLGVECGHGR